MATPEVLSFVQGLIAGDEEVIADMKDILNQEFFHNRNANNPASVDTFNALVQLVRDMDNDALHSDKVAVVELYADNGKHLRTENWDIPVTELTKENVYVPFDLRKHESFEYYRDHGIQVFVPLQRPYNMSAIL